MGVATCGAASVMVRKPAAWFVVLLSSLLSSTARSASPAAGPSSVDDEAPGAAYTQKVIELLAELIREVEGDGTADWNAHQAYVSWYTKEKDDAGIVIVDSNSSVISLTEELRHEKSLREQIQEELDEIAGALPAQEKELADGRARRKQENADYKELSSKLEDYIANLQRAVVVMQKEAPDQTELLQGPARGVLRKPPQSLLSIAKQLQQTMEEGEGGSNRKLSSAERELIGALFHAGKALQRQHRAEEGGRPPNFLQLSQSNKEGAARSDDDPDEYGEYESQVGGVTGLLGTVLQDTQQQLTDATNTEGDAAKAFKTFEDNLVLQIQTSKKRMEDLKTQFAQSQERTGRKTSELQEAKQLLEATQVALKKLEEQFAARTANFQERKEKREDELTALREAEDILTSGTSESLMALSSSVQLAGDSEIEPQAPRTLSAPSFLTVARQTHRRSRGATSMEGEQQSTVRGPFTKVKKMMEDMIERLSAAQAEDVKQKAWCDGEMRRTLESLRDKKAAVKKLTDRVEALDAEISTLEAEIPELELELNELQVALANATILRKQEHDAAAKAIGEYKAAQKPLKSAMEVLQKFYEKAGLQLQQLTKGSQDPAPEVAEKEAQYKAKSSAAAGVIGILEVALQDLIDLEKETQAQEEKAQQLYDEFQSDSQVRMAVLEKDVDYKKRMKVRLESERAREAKDLKDYQKELEAIEEYLTELKGTCTIKGDTYEVRKARREQEIQGLKDALTILEGENA